MHPVYGFTPPTFVAQGSYHRNPRPFVRFPTPVRNNPEMSPVVMGLAAVGIGVASTLAASKLVEPMENVEVIADKELAGVPAPALLAGTAIYLFGVFMGSTLGGKSDQG